MAEFGFLTIAFDPSFTGESGGSPRYVASPDINTDVLEHTGEAKASELSKKLADLPHDAQKRILQMVELMIQQEKENMN